MGTARYCHTPAQAPCSGGSDGNCWIFVGPGPLMTSGPDIVSWEWHGTSWDGLTWARWGEGRCQPGGGRRKPGGRSDTGGSVLSIRAQCEHPGVVIRDNTPLTGQHCQVHITQHFIENIYLTWGASPLTDIEFWGLSVNNDLHYPDTVLTWPGQVSRLPSMSLNTQWSLHYSVWDSVTETIPICCTRTHRRSVHG